jgi:hypothetical protein
MRREKPKSVKSETQKERQQQTPRESSETSLRTYIPVNLKILKKWMNFYILMVFQN